MEEAGELEELGGLVGGVTGKQQHVPRLDFPRKPHEEPRVDTQRWK